MKKTPHFLVGVDNLRRGSEDALQNFLLAAGPNVTGTGEFPEDNFGTFSAVGVNIALCSLARFLAFDLALDHWLG